MVCLEVKFHTNTCQCLKKAVSQVQNQEQTQELRLPESMPDIGNVLGAWGQVVIRGKEWRTGEMGVNGGVLAWVAYMPEDGSQVRSVETWIPFQMRWELPQTQRDGSICVMPLLNGVDARSTSARKLIVRANVSILGEALEPIEPEVCCPGQIPEDVQVLKKSYPTEVPVEAGEKLFEVDEELVLPGNLPQVQQILRFSLMPEVLEQKVMAGRLVFRGKNMLHLLYIDASGEIHSWDHEIPFSQFTELDKDHSAHAKAWIMVLNTGAELDLQEGNKLNLKASMAAQYVIYDCTMLEVAQDAYSPKRSVEIQTQSWDGPIRLEQRTDTLRLEHTAQLPCLKVVDISWLPEHPACKCNGDMAEITAHGQFQILYYDEDGNLQCTNTRTDMQWDIPTDPDNMICAYLRPDLQQQVQLGPDTVSISGNVILETSVFSQQGIPMIRAMELGEWKQENVNRPSLILRRTGTESLWEIAKECGSTVDAICKVNQIDGEPESERLLLSPVS